ncbi:MAG: hypothetical protein V3V47_00535 [Desulfobacteria bacterium]
MSVSEKGQVRPNAIDQAIELYNSVGKSRQELLTDIEEWVLRGCVIIFTRDLCLIAEDVRGEAWFVHLAIGDMHEMWSHAPYKLPQIGWKRDGVRKSGNRRDTGVKYYDFEKVLARTS